jgi:hypothetical protein
MTTPSYRAGQPEENRPQPPTPEELHAQRLDDARALESEIADRAAGYMQNPIVEAVRAVAEHENERGIALALVSIAKSLREIASRSR